ncbi:type II CAAX endopeptidase family protein [Sphingomonas sp. ASV193]|uniref:CPBP family intramembrane glutamic endopeptidase n=1 Tax=Sphingomonas sp. ASV193 TaxID=3144405 RepID=UPI0032E85ECD
MNQATVVPLASRSDIRRPEDGSSRGAFWFCALAFLFAWPVIIAAAAFVHGWSPWKVPGGLQMLAALSPGMAALTLSLRRFGGDGLKSLLASLVRWRVSPYLYAVALGLSVGLCLILYLTFRLATGVPDPLGSPVDLLMYFLLILPFSAVWEELGWRGYLLPRLLDRMKAVTAALLIGVIWGVWHLPMALAATTNPQAGLAQFGALFFGCIANSLLLTWLYLRSRGSVLLCVLFHNGVNAGAFYFFSGRPGSSAGPFWGLTIGLAIIAIPITASLSKRQRHHQPGVATSNHLE